MGDGPEVVDIKLKTYEVLTLTKIMRELFNRGELDYVISHLTDMERLDMMNVLESLLEEAINIEGFESKKED